MRSTPFQNPCFNLMIYRTLWTQNTNTIRYDASELRTTMICCLDLKSAVPPAHIKTVPECDAPLDFCYFNTSSAKARTVHYQCL